MRIYGESKERDLKQLPSSVPKFWHYRDGQTVFSSIAADWGNGYIMTGSGEPVQLLGANVTANYFDLLGVHPILGRNFLPRKKCKDDVATRDGKFLAQASRLRSGDSRSQHNTERRASHDRRRPAEPADLVVRPRLGDFCHKPFEPSGMRRKNAYARRQFHASAWPVETRRLDAQAQAAMPALAKVTRATPGKRPINTWSSVSCRERRCQPEICVRLS